MENNSNKLLKSLAKLKALRANLNTKSHITQERYVREYNGTIEEIADSIGDNLDTFMVPDQDIKPTITGGNYLTGETRYSNDLWTETQLLLTKADGAIGYLEMLLSHEEPKKTMGFSAE